MKHLRETFTDTEFQAMKIAKDDLTGRIGKKRLSWHDFLLITILQNYVEPKLPELKEE